MRPIALPLGLSAILSCAPVDAEQAEIDIRTTPLACEEATFAGHSSCERAALEERGISPAARIACEGACVIQTAGDDTLIVGPQGDPHRLEGMTFLHGNRPAYCLTTSLPFAKPDGSVILVDPNTRAIRTLPVPKAVPQPDAGSLSCDGSILWLRTDEAEEIRAFDAETGAALLTDDWLDTHRVLGPLGPTGNFVQAANSETGRIVLRDLPSAKDIPTDAVFEIDQIFLDQDESHLFVIRHGADPVSSDLYTLTAPPSFLARMERAFLAGDPIQIVRSDPGKALISLTVHQSE